MRCTVTICCLNRVSLIVPLLSLGSASKLQESGCFLSYQQVLRRGFWSLNDLWTDPLTGLGFLQPCLLEELLGLSDCSAPTPPPKSRQRAWHCLLVGCQTLRWNSPETPQVLAGRAASQRSCETRWVSDPGPPAMSACAPSAAVQRCGFLSHRLGGMAAPGPPWPTRVDSQADVKGLKQYFTART